MSKNKLIQESINFINVRLLLPRSRTILLQHSQRFTYRQFRLIPPSPRTQTKNDRLLPIRKTEKAGASSLIKKVENIELSPHYKQLKVSA